uniref:Uncharacterized protein n=1 Tax=Anguilla anguilla TaxID=7936 RepID=A0A0E9VAR1_ANGAN
MTSSTHFLLQSRISPGRSWRGWRSTTSRVGSWTPRPRSWWRRGTPPSPSWASD